jgi:L-cysteine S-thiosulfotransferase
MLDLRVAAAPSILARRNLRGRRTNYGAQMFDLTRVRIIVGALLLLAAAALPALAQEDATERELEKYRAMMRDPFANPGLLSVDRGETLWLTPRGPKNGTLEACDLGKGPGKLDGAFAELPRYFEDAGRVMDLEARLVWCMENLQGYDRKQILQTRFSTLERDSDLEALAAFIASRSNGMKFALKLEHPKEKEAYTAGEAIFFRRQGPMDFSCATCHGENGRRIRLQELPNFGDPKQTQAVMGAWPAFRVSQNPPNGALRTMEHRLYDCVWQMRLPQVDYGSDVTVALTTYLAKQAEGGVIEVPSVKR